MAVNELSGDQDPTGMVVNELMNHSSSAGGKPQLMVVNELRGDQDHAGNFKSWPISILHH